MVQEMLREDEKGGKTWEKSLILVLQALPLLHPRLSDPAHTNSLSRWVTLITLAITLWFDPPDNPDHLDNSDNLFK